MEANGCTFKYINEQEFHRTEYSHNTSGGEVYLSRARQEEIKNLMFSALEDPREKYKKVTIDEMTEKWVDPKTLTKAEDLEKVKHLTEASN